MKRSTFLAFTATVAFVVGAFALFAPATLLATKGISSSTTDVWVREVGVLLLAVGATTFMVRNHENSPTLRALLVSNAVIQVGLFPIEILAYHEGVIVTLSGIVPNSIIHLCLAVGFIYYIVKMAR